ncbi:hypothetical protein [Chitinophaga niabensis]|uniref:Outer membrane lipoprotein-sorting protein n=1 Tax=Chitinophaga niabensis TaxID=536979 RepID=A0A1N6DEG3_9BACT|nr:hypothetical protein [Chitinophaga niabensis]SIN69209.1 hypothetical protein SAMN04488055_0669 [Chitinophaga niabensis]
MYRTIVLLIASLIWLPAANAQEKLDTGRLETLLAKVRDVYRNGPMSFNVRYTAAAESQPALPLDSIQGEVAVNGVYCYYRLPGMETITNPRYNIILFKEDKLMYLTKPSVQAVQDPMLPVRTLLKAGKLQEIAVREEGKHQLLSMTFDAQSACRNMLLEIEKSTGYVQHIRYELKTELLPGLFNGEADEDRTTYGKFVIVRMVFYNYKKLDGDLGRFDEKNFFYLDGTEFKTASAYNDYTIFKGTPNL